MASFPAWARKAASTMGLFAGSSICFLTLIVLGTFLYNKLHRQREACRQVLIALLCRSPGYCATIIGGSMSEVGF